VSTLSFNIHSTFLCQHPATVSCCARHNPLYIFLLYLHSPKGEGVNKNQQSRQTGSRNLTGPKTLPTIWYTYMMRVTKYQISALNSVAFFLSNYWWQESDIWSQASYRYPISWEAFLNPSDSYFLFADFVDFYTRLTYICICTFMGYLYKACDQISDFCHQ
jgi:hypothetical protein